MENTGIILQARMSSSRCPGKVGHEILGKPLLQYQIERLKQSAIKNIVVATSTDKRDDVVADIAAKAGVKYFRGSLNDVLDRYYQAALTHEIDTIIRVCGDDPMVDPQCINSLVSAYQTKRANYIYSGHPAGWIYGTTAELIEMSALKLAHEEATSAVDREHVVPYIKRNAEIFSRYRISPANNKLVRPDIFITVDYPEDLEVVQSLLLHLAEEGKLDSYQQEDIIALYDSGKIRIGNKHLHSGFGE